MNNDYIVEDDNISGWTLFDVDFEEE